jgi:ribonuclease J
MGFITVYDGAYCIGGNKIYLEENGRGVLLDFGMNFSKYGEYYQEFLKERSNRGIYDLIHLGMIPKLNFYRPDLIPTDVGPSQWQKPNVEAVLLSHAHLDHYGNISLLRGDTPIVTSASSAAILKAMRDSAPASLGSEISYYSPKTPTPDCGGFVLESKSGGSYTARDLYLCTDPTPELVDFASNRPGGNTKRSKTVDAGAVEPLNKLNLPFQVEPYPVDHSIPGAVAYIIRGDITIAYTGDYRLHGAGADDTRRFIQAARDASVLITEGTRVGRETDEETTEHEVLRNCRASTEEEKGHLLCFSFFDLKHLLDINTEGGTYIYSSSEAHSEEQEFDFQRLSQWLNFFNLHSVGFKMTGDPPKPEFIRGFHASGHLSQNDLVKVIEEIDPDKIISIHTQHPEWFKTTFPRTVMIPADGKVNL